MEETREATADLPDENCSLFKRNGHQAPTIRREAARRKPLPVTLQHVEARGCLEVVHHNRALARPHGQALARRVEVYSREATQGERKNGSCQFKLSIKGRKSGAHVFTTCPRISVAVSWTASRCDVEFGSRDFTTASISFGRLGRRIRGF
jgi:hypothetical protein